MRWRAWAVAAAVAAVAPGCALLRPRPEPPPVVAGVQTGEASWYGPGFHGRATASGEIFDQNALTAAHPSLPLGSRTRITSLTNRRSVDVRINDRGPFVGGRIVDLSYAAACRIDMIGPGVMPVRLEVLDTPARVGRRRPSRSRHPAETRAAATRPVATAPPPLAAPPPPPAYVVRLGTFRERAAADEVQRTVAQRFPEARVMPLADGDTFEVELGPYAARRSADARAEIIGRLGYTTTVVAASPRR